jgi:hypothetical protein
VGPGDGPLGRTTHNPAPLEPTTDPDAAIGGSTSHLLARGVPYARVRAQQNEGSVAGLVEPGADPCRAPGSEGAGRSRIAGTQSQAADRPGETNTRLGSRLPASALGRFPGASPGYVCFAELLLNLP